MATALLKELPWNLVTKNLHGHELLRKKLREKISKLEKHLKHFPADTVHLHIALERHPRREYYTAALTLRVPSNILRSKKSGPDLIKTFDDAVKALMRELESLKAELRRETFWKRKGRRDQLRRLKTTGFNAQPQAEGIGPQNETDVLQELLEQHNRRLLRYMRRHLWHEVVTGELPSGAVDARAVLDEVAGRALAEPHKKPAEMGYLLWLYVLARQEIARRCKEFKTWAKEMISLEAPKIIRDDAEAAAGYDPEQPLDIIENELEPPLAETKDLLPDARVESPDKIASRHDLLAQMRKTANTWAKPEREMFELYFVEGFEPEEIAMIMGQSSNSVNELIVLLQKRLRTEVLDQAVV
ncbi:MAG TPA: HPF/RaiA family ribosome-associated protein [Alphaproteobacteria bacterium]|nr:HPF/RaiA family ribosome-associated protein [Alphaproteobacteria bacterium]